LLLIFGNSYQRWNSINLTSRPLIHFTLTNQVLPCGMKNNTFLFFNLENYFSSFPLILHVVGCSSLLAYSVVLMPGPVIWQDQVVIRWFLFLFFIILLKWYCFDLKKKINLVTGQNSELGPWTGSGLKTIGDTQPALDGGAQLYCLRLWFFESPGFWNLLKNLFWETLIQQYFFFLFLIQIILIFFIWKTIFLFYYN
jgi:hypothetical protein